MRLKEKVKKLEQKYNLLTDNMVDVIWVVDLETQKYEYVTPSIERITGFTPDEYLNSTCKQMLGVDSFSKIFSMLDDEKKGFVEQGIGSIHQFEFEAIKKDGSYIWLEARGRLYREEGESIKVVCATRDIDKRKIAELKQNELVEKLEQSLAEKEMLLDEVKTLRGLLPICSGCKRIRDENGKWWPLDIYVTRKTDTDLTHTICSDCADVYYGDL